MRQDEFTIQDLCNQTGLPRRTIHFYIQQEILPPPQGSGLGAYYLAEHLVRLKLIPILRKQGLKLDDIRQKYQASSSAELETLLSETQPPVLPALTAAPPPPSPALPRPSQTYQAYRLPHGILLFVPQDLAPELQTRLDQLLPALLTSL